MPKVMIAEDDLYMADMLEEILVDSNYEVCGIARTVDEAVALGERHKPDLAILDIRLAEGGLGTEIPGRWPKRDRPGVLYATAYAGQTGLTKSDGEASLTKPYRPEDVIRALQIVEELVSTGKASRPYPHGLALLNGSSTSDTAPGTAIPVPMRLRDSADSRRHSRHSAHMLLAKMIWARYLPRPPVSVPAV